MAGKMSYVAVEAVLIIILLFIPIVRSSINEPIPADKSKLQRWFDRNVRPIASRTRGGLDRSVATGERNVTVVKVKADGSGDFKTIGDAVKSVPVNNKNRVIVCIGPGTYNEKVKIERRKPFVTLYGDPRNMPSVVYGGTAAKYGTMDSATLIVDADHFSAVNLKFRNSAPRPDGKRVGAQAVALRVEGDSASFYNCKFYGFQDTLCDDMGRHFYKDCYIEGTIDFIFGNGQTIFLNTEIHVLPGDPMAFIAAHSRKSASDTSGYIFLHCRVTGAGENTYLARSWFPYGRVVYAYSELTNVVDPEGFSSRKGTKDYETVYFGEYKNIGAGSDLSKRAAFTKKLSAAKAKPFLSLAFIEGARWLLPPPKV